MRNVKNLRQKRILERQLLTISLKLQEKKRINYKLGRAMQLNFSKENFCLTFHLLVKEILKRHTLWGT